MAKELLMNQLSMAEGVFMPSLIESNLIESNSTRQNSSPKS